MATYVIGDVQGCFATLQRLVETIGYDRARDRLVFVGDLVNRGPRNLETLRWMVSQDDAVEAVLGNHDVHLLARARGLAGAKKRDTLGDVLEAPDTPRLLEWLRRRPFLLEVEGHVVVHAGLLPGMSLAEAREQSAALSEAFRGPALDDLLHELRLTPDRWSHAHDRQARRRAAMQGFLFLRTCHADGTPEPHFAGALGELPPGCRPWFDFEPERWAGRTVLFGHWAALGLHAANAARCLDSGCVWGRDLTAFRLEDAQLFSVANVDFPGAHT